MNAICKTGLCLCATILFGAATTSAQVKVSVTLSGSVEEMLPILQHLRDMGYGDAAEIEVEGGDEALRMSVHSVMTNDELPVADGEAEAAPLGLGLFKAAFEPASAKGGQVALLTVAVNDPDNKVDTVAATFRDLPGQTLDLFDNGTQGDRTVGDGIWSRRVQVFPTLQPGQHMIEITAYDVDGKPVQTEDDKPLKTEAALTVE